MKTNNNTSIIGYGRTAIERQRDQALTTQRVVCESVAAAHGRPLEAMFFDVASGEDESRGGFDELIAFLQDRPDDQPCVVVVDQVQRISRSIGVFGRLEARIHQAGAKLVSPQLHDVPEPLQEKMFERILGPKPSGIRLGLSRLAEWIRARRRHTIA